MRKYEKKEIGYSHRGWWGYSHGDREMEVRFHPPENYKGDNIEDYLDVNFFSLVPDDAEEVLSYYADEMINHAFEQIGWRSGSYHWYSWEDYNPRMLDGEIEPVRRFEDKLSDSFPWQEESLWGDKEFVKNSLISLIKREVEKRRQEDAAYIREAQERANEYKKIVILEGDGWKIEDNGVLSLEIYENRQPCRFSFAVGGARVITRKVITNNSKGLSFIRIDEEEDAPSWKHENSGRTIKVRIETASFYVESPFNGWIAIEEEIYREGYPGRWKKITPIIGSMPEHLHFGDAYQAWAWEEEEGAMEFLIKKLPNSRLRNSASYAAGYKNPYAAHEDRSRAWKHVMRKMGIPTFRVGSVRTATVRAAIKLGYAPSKPQPEYWEGLPEGVVSLPEEE